MGWFGFVLLFSGVSFEKQTLRDMDPSRDAMCQREAKIGSFALQTLMGSVIKGSRLI